MVIARQKLERSADADAAREALLLEDDRRLTAMLLAEDAKLRAAHELALLSST